MRLGRSNESTDTPRHNKVSNSFYFELVRFYVGMKRVGGITAYHVSETKVVIPYLHKDIAGNL